MRVFISYAQDDAAHVDLVRQFRDFLREQGGVDARLDLPAAERPRDWPAWMQEQLEESDFVLVVASPEYKKRAEDKAPGDEARGVRWETRLIREMSYADHQAGLTKVLPVVLPGRAATEIPLWLGPTSRTHYVVTDFTFVGAEALLRYLTGQPYEADPPASVPPVLPPRGAGSALDVSEPAAGVHAASLAHSVVAQESRPPREDSPPRVRVSGPRHPSRWRRRWLGWGLPVGVAVVLAAVAVTTLSWYGRHQRAAGPAAGSSGQQTFPGYQTVYSDRVVRLPGPPYCSRTLVDLDTATVTTQVEPTARISRDIDLNYDGCGAILTRNDTGSKAAGFAPAGNLTPARCMQAALSNALAPDEQVTKFPRGTAACVITNTGAVAWLRVREAGGPYAQPAEDPPHLTLELLVTLWRPK
ncbi:MAG TPA: SEFIR domain-containing protein [Mycobacteriales bacterium]|nr:SEFIR domain-containing protein [Mycobacteriales bacterium]